MTINHLWSFPAREHVRSEKSVDNRKCFVLQIQAKHFTTAFCIEWFLVWWRTRSRGHAVSHSPDPLFRTHHAAIVWDSSYCHACLRWHPITGTGVNGVRCVLETCCDLIPHSRSLFTKRLNESVFLFFFVSHLTFFLDVLLTGVLLCIRASDKWKCKPLWMGIRHDHITLRVCLDAN